jgi:two-component system OmpR family sensor kinase/two-component system sensor histidine kinase BaeS
VKRLQVQLILAFTLVVLVAVGAIAILMMRTTDTEFRQYVTNSGMQASGSGLEQLVAYYEKHGSWDGVASILGQGVFLSGPGGRFLPNANWHSARPPGQLDVVLADASGKIVYDSAAKMNGKKLSSRARSQALPITQSDGGEAIGYLLLSVPGEWTMLGRLEQQFLDGMRNILITAAALAAGLGLIMGVLLSRSLTAPLQRLAIAARAVAGGDLDHKVRVEGSIEIAEVGRAFNEMTTALGESERQRQNMVADVAHELRTPLSVVQGSLRAILDDVYDLDKAEISRLYDETRLLSRLVDDLRELALADAGQLRLNPRPTSLDRVIHDSIDNLALGAEAREVSLTALLPDDLLAVQADPDRVSQVLRNLLVNALLYTPAGGSVTVNASSANGMVEVAVADTGVGIDPEDLPHIFERFWRADPARARMGSTGLGLSIAQSLVEAQGGRIWAESAPGQGSTFRFTLPVVQSAR